MLDELKAAEHALSKAHAALKEAARLNDEAAVIYLANELQLRRAASDLNEIHAREAEEQYLAEQGEN
jgi:hypothetical protein